MKKLKALISSFLMMTMLFSYGFTVNAADKGLFMPKYENIVSAVNTVNGHYQESVKYDQSELGIPDCFLYKTVYQTGNIEAYYLTGNEAYLEYAENWAESCNWTGHPEEQGKDSWSWSYSQSVTGNAVLFSHFQGCFQVYIDLYNIEKDASGGEIADKKKIQRAIEVMSYQTEKEEDSFWWMADSLYMCLPVMVKLYHLTGEEKYLDSMYKYFKYTKELLYDGPGGIPENGDEYTTSAKLKEGAEYSQQDEYEHLFYQVADHVYPLKSYGKSNEKYFSSTANGLAFAGLAKVLNELPETYEHYDEFLSTYIQLAQAVKNNMCTDEDGYGFWTQNILLKEPVSAYNPNGYETYSTALFTYALAWGINAGVLDGEEYGQTVIRAWNYLENVALQPDGSVGYCYDIASSAVRASSVKSNVNSYGVGAFLLAGCEMSRFVEKSGNTELETDMSSVLLRMLSALIDKTETLLKEVLDK